MATIIELLELEAILGDIESHQRDVLLARNYFNGKQDVILTNGSRDFLGLHANNEFRFNICRTIVTALAGELNLLGMGTDEAGDERKPVAEWAAEVYARNKLDSLQDTITESALADSESFVIVEWDPLEEYPRIIYNPFYVSPDAEGDGMGVFAIYENDDPDQKMIAAVKQWIETTRVGGMRNGLSRIRRTVYYPDHFERWVFDNASWEHFTEEDEETGELTRDWSIPNTDGAGVPLGIPVFHFKNKGLRPEHWDGIPMQDAINKTLVDILAAGDLTAFQSYFGFGFFPTTDGKAPKDDGSNLMMMGPGQFNGTSKKPDEAAVQVITGADPTPLVNVFKDLILATAQITDTPASRFVITAAIASDKTIKEQERALRKKAGDRRGLFADPWVGVFDMARKLANVYGHATLSDTVAFSPIWEYTESLDELKEKKDSLSLPIEQIWKEAGYSDKEIESMKAAPSYRVEFERKLWEGANAASLNGAPLSLYLKRLGLPYEEIKEIIDAIENRSPIPAIDL